MAGARDEARNQGELMNERLVARQAGPTVAAPPLGYFGQPEPVSHAGIVLLPTIFGVDRFARDTADALAAAGIAALVWDPYPGQLPPASVPEALARAATLEDEACLKRMSNCVDHLLDQRGLKAVATLGFCLGGRFSMLLGARDRRLAACLAYYPSIRVPNLPHQEQDAVARAVEIDCPVQLVCAGQDDVIKRDTVLRLQAALQERRVPTIVQYYPEAGHSFMATTRPTAPAADRKAALLSWPQSIAFLRDCLALAIEEAAG